jgi:hypothetical protein
MLTTVRRRIAAAFATLLFVPVLVLSGPGTASADNGFCGVRSSEGSAGMSYVYTVRNKCLTTWRFKVWLPAYGHYAIGSNSGTACQTVYAGGYGTYWWPNPDRNWTVRVC